MMETKTNAESTRDARGRARRVVGADLVERLAAIACTPDEIARVVDCSVHTIGRNFEEALNRGASRARVSLRRRQFKAAMAGDVDMLMWLGRVWLGQHENGQVSDDSKLD